MKSFEQIAKAIDETCETDRHKAMPLPLALAQATKLRTAICLLEEGSADDVDLDDLSISASTLESLHARVQELEDHIAGQGQDDLRTAALQDSAYAAGMLSGWNFCIADDNDMFSKVRGERMTGAVRALKDARAAAPAKPQADALDAERLDWLIEQWRSNGVVYEFNKSFWMAWLDGHDAHKDEHQIGRYHTAREAIDAAIAAAKEKS